MKMLLLFVLIPLAAAVLIPLCARRIRGLSGIITALATASLFLLSLVLFKASSVSTMVVFDIGGWVAPLGIALVADALSIFMLLTVNLVSLLVVFFALRQMQKYTETWKFYSLFLLMLCGLNGIIISGDLFNLYIFLEVASLAAYALVAFGVEPQDLEASFKYAVMGSIASIFILLGIALTYSYVSTLNMAGISLALANKHSGLLVSFIAVLFLAGFGLKAAIVPFHAWLPDAHSSAPAPVSAILSGVFIKTLGIYAVLRILFNIFGVSIAKISLVLMVLGIASMVMGALLAIIQTDIKRMFAYSSISQIGYIVFALGIGTPLAIMGGLFHLFNHAVAKSLMFLNSGAIEYATGERNLNKLGGLNQKLPITGYAGLLGSMSIAGVPPFAGFFSKLVIIIAAVQAGYLGMGLIAVLVSIITLGYYLRFQSFTFFGSLNSAYEGVKEVPLSMKLSMMTLGLICLGAAGILLFPNVLDFFNSVVACVALK